MDWKSSLDKYLTTPPDDGYDGWYEQVIEILPDDFYEPNQDWLVTSSFDSQCNKWMWKMFRKGHHPEQAGKILQRTFNLYLNHSRV